jgi:integral membrane sensor domain MASE1
MITGAPALLALGLAAGNTLEAVVGVVVLKRVFHFQPSLERLHDVFGLVVASLVAAAVSATIGLDIVSSAWAVVGVRGFGWYVGNLLGALVVAPVILVWATPRQASPGARPGGGCRLLPKRGQLVGVQQPTSRNIRPPGADV